MTDDKPPVYYEDELLVIRASAIGGGCLWELVACGQGYAPNNYPANIRRAFDEGNRLEPVILERLEKEHGFKFESKQVEGELILGDGVVVRYHPDGIASWSASATGNFTYDWVVEAKALSHDVWVKAAKHGVANVFDEYPWQLSVMMHGEMKPGVWAAYNKGYAPDENGVKRECEDQGKLLLQPNLKPLYSLEEIREKAFKIKELVEGEDILESGRPCDSPNHWPCLYLHLRPEEEGDRMDNSIGMEVDEQVLDQLVKEYVGFKGAADEAKKRADVVRDEIIELAGGVKGVIVTDKWVVPVYEGHGARRLDWAGMDAEFKAKVEEYQMPGKSYLYLRDIKRRD